jgi:hypothetical protein
MVRRSDLRFVATFGGRHSPASAGKPVRTQGVAQARDAARVLFSHRFASTPQHPCHLLPRKSDAIGQGLGGEKEVIPRGFKHRAYPPDRQAVPEVITCRR